MELGSIFHYFGRNFTWALSMPRICPESAKNMPRTSWSTIAPTHLSQIHPTRSTNQVTDRKVPKSWGGGAPASGRHQLNPPPPFRDARRAKPEAGFFEFKSQIASAHSAGPCTIDALGPPKSSFFVAFCRSQNSSKNGRLPDHSKIDKDGPKSAQGG